MYVIYVGKHRLRKSYLKEFEDRNMHLETLKAPKMDSAEAVEEQLVPPARGASSRPRDRPGR